MENYQVSARKYRPSQFEEVVGQAHITATLKNALRNQQLAQSFLFCGPRGVGKTTCARILAKVINCENPTKDYAACNECAACQASNQSVSFNIFELDAASNNSVEDIRKLIEQVRFAPQTGKYKVYIIDEVHMLSSSAFNAFLKTLEEPPSYVIFIMATTEKHKLLPTILSRCQIFDFRRIGVNDIANHLKTICEKEGIQAEEEALHVIGQKADGALRDGLSIFDRVVSFANKDIRYSEILSVLNILDYDYYFSITDALLAQDGTQAMLYLEEILEKGFDGGELLNGLAQHFRNLLFAKDAQTAAVLEVSEQLQERYVKQSQLISPSFLLSGLNLTNEYALNYRASQNKRLQVELALLKVAYLQSALNVEKLAQAPAAPLPQKKNPVTPVANIQEPPPPIVEPKVSYATPSNPKPVEPVAKVVNLTPTAEKMPKKEEKEKKPATKKTGSISQKLKGLKKRKKEEKETKLESIDKIAQQEAEKAAAFKERTTLTEYGMSSEEIQKHWSIFKDSLDSPRLQAAFASAMPIIKDGVIYAKANSRIDQITIQQECRDFVKKLSDDLNLKEVEVEIDVDLEKSAEISKEILTTEDKLNALIEQNPAIDEFTKRLVLALKY